MQMFDQSDTYFVVYCYNEAGVGTLLDTRHETKQTGTNEDIYDADCNTSSGFESGRDGHELCVKICSFKIILSIFIRVSLGALAYQLAG